MGAPHRLRTPKGGGEKGSGTVLLVGAMGVVVVLTAGGLHLAAAAVATHRARAAADLSALAAASAVQWGRGDPCTVAELVARRNEARLSSCELERGDSVRVVVATDLAIAWPGVRDGATASAVAGPAGPLGPAGPAGPVTSAT